MALVKFGGGITQMSGSIAGNTFARNRSGNYVRARTKPVNPNSVSQVSIRAAMKYFTQYWHATLSVAQRQTWITYANAVAMKNKLGETTYLSGFNMYIRYNVFRMFTGQNKADSCLGELSLPETDAACTVTAYVDTQKFDINFTKPMDWQAIPGSVMAIFMGQTQVKTRNFFAGPWKFAAYVPGNQATPCLTGVVPFSFTLNQKIWTYHRIATGSTDGRLSEPLIMIATILETKV